MYELGVDYSLIDVVELGLNVGILKLYNNKNMVCIMMAYKHMLDTQCDNKTLTDKTHPINYIHTLLFHP